jgi:hypothetical protein
MPSSTVLFVVAAISIVSLFAWVGLVWKNVQTAWEATAAERAKYAGMKPSDVVTGVTAPAAEVEKTELGEKPKGKKKPGKKKPVAKAEAATETEPADEPKSASSDEEASDDSKTDDDSKKEA